MSKNQPTAAEAGEAKIAVEVEVPICSLGPDRRPTNVAVDAVRTAHLDRDHDPVDAHRELPSLENDGNRIEGKTAPTSPGRLFVSIRGMRLALFRTAARVGSAIYFSGHPFETTDDLVPPQGRIVDPGPGGRPGIDVGDRYVAYNRNIGEGRVRLALTCGEHVHSDEADKDRATKIHYYIRQALPLLTALAANSPLSNGKFGNLESERAHRWGALPTNLWEPPVATYRQAVAYQEKELRRRNIDNADSTLWHSDFRVAKNIPTAETRDADTQATVIESTVHALLRDALYAWGGAQLDEYGWPPSGPYGTDRDEQWLRDARFHAAKGTSDVLLDPKTGSKRQARLAIWDFYKAELRPFVEERGRLAVTMCDDVLAAVLGPPRRPELALGTGSRRFIETTFAVLAERQRYSMDTIGPEGLLRGMTLRPGDVDDLVVISSIEGLLGDPRAHHGRVTVERLALMTELWSEHPSSRQQALVSVVDAGAEFMTSKVGSAVLSGAGRGLGGLR